MGRADGGSARSGFRNEGVLGYLTSQTSSFDVASTATTQALIAVSVKKDWRLN